VYNNEAEPHIKSALQILSPEFLYFHFMPLNFEHHTQFFASTILDFPPDRTGNGEQVMFAKI